MRKQWCSSARKDMVRPYFPTNCEIINVKQHLPLTSTIDINMNAGVYLIGRPNDDRTRELLQVLVEGPEKSPFTFVPLSAEVAPYDASGVEDSRNESVVFLRCDGIETRLTDSKVTPKSQHLPTPVVALGTPDAPRCVQDLIRTGKSFHFVPVQKTHVKPRKNVPLATDMHSITQRDVSGPLPGGLVVFGTKNCTFTKQSASLLVLNKISFYYIDVTGYMGHYHETLGNARLGQKYLFEDKPSLSSFHKTVPILFLDGKLIGGHTQLQYALENEMANQEVQNIVSEFDSRVSYFEIPATFEAVWEAVKDGKVVRAVHVTSECSPGT